MDRLDVQFALDVVDGPNVRFVLDAVDRLDVIDGLDWRSVTLKAY